jgi:hypothetical protein
MSDLVKILRSQLKDAIGGGCCQLQLVSSVADKEKSYISLRTRIRDPGWVKNQDPDLDG